MYKEIPFCISKRTTCSRYSIFNVRNVACYDETGRKNVPNVQNEHFGISLHGRNGCRAERMRSGLHELARELPN